MDRDPSPTASSPGWNRLLGRGLWSVALLVVVGLAGQRGIDAVANRPVDALAGGPGPTAVVIVQEGDCPDRRAALEAWLRDVQEGAPGPGSPQLQRLILRGTVPASHAGLAGLPDISPENEAALVRALRRSGTVGTPALVLFDDRGQPLFAGGFELDGPPAGLAPAARALDALTARARPNSRGQPDAVP